jgi:hypothetical protein
MVTRKDKIQSVYEVMNKVGFDKEDINRFELFLCNLYGCTLRTAKEYIKVARAIKEYEDGDKKI